jgi:hypothetical protein
LEVQLKRPKFCVIALGLPLKVFSLQPIYLSFSFLLPASSFQLPPSTFQLRASPEALLFTSLLIDGLLIHR